MDNLQAELYLPGNMSISRKRFHCNKAIEDLMKKYIEGQEIFIKENDLGKSNLIGFKVIKILEDRPESLCQMFRAILEPITFEEQVLKVPQFKAVTRKLTWKERIKILFKGEVDEQEVVW